jgi:hypothetical protein
MNFNKNDRVAIIFESAKSFLLLHMDHRLLVTESSVAEYGRLTWLHSGLPTTAGFYPIVLSEQRILSSLPMRWYVWSFCEYLPASNTPRYTY